MDTRVIVIIFSIDEIVADEPDIVLRRRAVREKDAMGGDLLTRPDNGRNLLYNLIAHAKSYLFPVKPRYLIYVCISRCKR